MPAKQSHDQTISVGQIFSHIESCEMKYFDSVEVKRRGVDHPTSYVIIRTRVNTLSPWALLQVRRRIYRSLQLFSSYT